MKEVVKFRECFVCGDENECGLDELVNLCTIPGGYFSKRPSLADLDLVLQSIGIPLEGIALILGVERFLDMARTAVNVTSDLSCTSVISYHLERGNQI